MTGCCPNVHRTLTQRWECLKGTGQGRGWGERSHCKSFVGPKLSPPGFNISLWKIMTWRNIVSLSFWTTKWQDALSRWKSCIWPHHPWVESVYHWHFASRKPRTSTNCLIYRHIVRDLLTWGTQSPLEDEEGTASMCMTLNSWILLIIVLEGWTWWLLQYPWKSQILWLFFC